MQNISTYLILLPVMAVLSSAISCSRTEYDIQSADDDIIAFSAPGITMDVATRAGANDFLDAIPEGTSFGVLGYCLAYNPGTTTYNPNSGASQWSLKRDLCPPSVFYNQEVTVGQGDACSYKPLKRWYTDGNIDGLGVELSNTDDYRYTFYAYYPYEENVNDGEGFSIVPADKSTAGAPVITYTMPFSDNQEVSLDNKVPDAMLAVQQNVQRSGRSVGFNFSHIMTGLGFQINNFSQVAETVEGPEDEGGVDLVIYSIKLQGEFHKSVRVDMTGAAAEVSYEGTYSVTYTIFESEDGMLIPWQQDGSRGSISMEPETYLRLLPGDENVGYFGPTGGTNPKLILDYKLGDNERTTVSRDRPGNFMPRSGVRYTAQINWVKNAFVLVVQADNGEIWEDGEADDGNTGNDDIIFM